MLLREESLLVAAPAVTATAAAVVISQGACQCPLLGQGSSHVLEVHSGTAPGCCLGGGGAGGPPSHEDDLGCGGGAYMANTARKGENQPQAAEAVIAVPHAETHACIQAQVCADAARHADRGARVQLTAVFTLVMPARAEAVPHIHDDPHMYENVACLWLL